MTSLLFVALTCIYVPLVYCQLYTTKTSVTCSGPPTVNETQPWWLKDAPFQDTQTGSIPTSVDITIIGAGIAGTSVLYHLTNDFNKNNMSNMTSILFLDARGSAGGASGRNAGSLHTSENRAFYKTFHRYGENIAVKQYNFTLQNVQDIVDFVDLYNISCDLELGMFLNPIVNEKDIDLRKESIELMHDFNIGMDETLLNVSSIKNILNSTSFIGGVHGPFSYNINPAKLVFGVLNISVMNSIINDINLNIQFKTTVNSVVKQNNSALYDIITERGNISSKYVVFATNAYSSNLLPEFCNYIFPVKAQQFISQPLLHLIWENHNISGIKTYFNGSLIYLTQYLTNKRIMILSTKNDLSWNGNYNDSEIDKNMTNYLKQYLEINYDLNDEIEIDMEWQGIVGATKDGFPFIGPIIDMPNAYISAGYHGLGLSEAFNAGKAIANMIINGNVDEIEYFDDIFLPSSRMNASCDSDDIQQK